MASTSSLCFGVTCRQAAPGVARLVGDVAVDVEQSPLSHPGVGEGINKDDPVAEFLRLFYCLDVLSRLEGGLDATDIVCAEMIVELPGTPFRVDQGNPAAETEGDEEGRVSLSRTGGTRDGQPELAFFSFRFMKHGHSLLSWWRSFP